MTRRYCPWDRSWDCPLDRAMTPSDAAPTCACGGNLNIWQNPWNHEPGCDMQPVPTAAGTKL